MPCTICTCAELHPSHKILATLMNSDLDAALVHGLLDASICPTCKPRCNALLVTARDARLTALAARDRHREREVRLQRRRSLREAARVPKPPPTQATALPPAAADVLARALAKARTPR